MRKIVVGTFVSLDGVMQAPGGPEEDPTGGFDQGGWVVGYFDEALGQHMDESISKPFDLLLGRKTYEIFAAHWPHVTGDPMADALNRAHKYVVSTTLGQGNWPHTTLIRGDVPRELSSLKQQDGPDLQVYGSSELIQTLLRHDLVDEFRLRIFPALLGRGKRLFGDGAIPAGLRLTGTQQTSTGVIMATYERDGEVKRGSFALEEPTEAEVERRRRLE